MRRSNALPTIFNLIAVAIALDPHPAASFQTVSSKSDIAIPAFGDASKSNASTLTDQLNPECLTHEEGSDLATINILHCYQFLTYLLATGSPSPVPWNTPEYPVPKIWTHGTCMITFDKMSTTAWDVFSALQIAKAVALILVKCVKADTHWLGGKVPVGPRMGFQIAVFGRGTLTTAEEKSNLGVN